MISFGHRCFDGDEIFIPSPFFFLFPKDCVTVCLAVEHLPDANVAAGKDMQGISFEKMLFGRDKYQEMRMKVLEITRI